MLGIAIGVKMSLPIENIRAVIVAPAEIKTSRRGEYASMIIDVGTKVADHWYANIYPEDTQDNFGDLQSVCNARRGEQIIFNGRVRRWTRQSTSSAGTGVTIDILEGSVVDDNENTRIEPTTPA